MAGRQGLSAAALRNPNKDNELRGKFLDRSDLGFQIFAFAFVRSRLFSGFASAMTLEMSLAVDVSRVPLVGNVRLKTPSPRSAKPYGVARDESRFAF